MEPTPVATPPFGYTAEIKTKDDLKAIVDSQDILVMCTDTWADLKARLGFDTYNDETGCHGEPLGVVLCCPKDGFGDLINAKWVCGAGLPCKRLPGIEGDYKIRGLYLRFASSGGNRDWATVLAYTAYHLDGDNVDEELLVELATLVSADAFLRYPLSLILWVPFSDDNIFIVRDRAAVLDDYCAENPGLDEFEFSGVLAEDPALPADTFVHIPALGKHQVDLELYRKYCSDCMGRPFKTAMVARYMHRTIDPE